ncbi:hypothetical protein LTR99_001935 [Exophiala xenobiotica]|uniref:Uncharacterized protein n=1 Tax=Vermiconidia calcicola TaxID=1690605 RepID=A0AAV9Q992_9PEZI|nr:hypothetical protein LTR92_004352 [Exophiala xenobiotica]KAK5306245.1 hypothetical protein LTR99_001935 [Exophiala xenobiotica]KAK5429841.1 hypothetical protein LTR34_006542 [Exophiala xenobiotica]KAK5536703.1 hypothetical protein LTR25_005377 [Vermiconidia calcicola]
MAYLVATAMPTTEKVKVNLNLNLNLNKLNLNRRTHSKVQGTDLATLTSISSGIFGQDKDRDVAGVHVAAREEEGEAPARRVAVHVAPATARKGDARSGVTMAAVTARHFGIGARGAYGDGDVGDGGPGRGRRARARGPVRDIWQRAFAPRGRDGRRRRRGRAGRAGRARGESCCSTCGPSDSDEDSDIDRREYGVRPDHLGGRRRGARQVQPRQGAGDADADGEGRVAEGGDLEGVQAGVGPAGDWADGRRRGPAEPGRRNRGGFDMGMGMGMMRRGFPGFDMEVALGVHVRMHMQRG